MGSRVRENPDNIFICFCEIVAPSDTESRPWILQKYPEEFENEEMLKSVPDFACPCEFTSDGVQHFSFVLTSLDSKWTYGFCRHAPNQPTLFCFLSSLPWHETFYKLLNHIADLTNDQQTGLLSKFLQVLYKSEVPSPGSDLHLTYNLKNFQVHCSDHLKLPSIPENRNLTEYFNAVDAHNMMVVFASMLHERRILITSKKLSRLSACVQAANAIIYPMHWQHIFIPVLPMHLLDYISAPMPFLIGAPSNTLLKVKQSELSEIVVLDADNNRVRTPFQDYETLPVEIVSSLKRHLKNPNSLLGDGVSRAFLRALVQLIGGYREALKMTLGEKITFDKEAFIMTRPLSIQPFLQSMLHLQIFQQFIDDRLEMLNLGTGFSDEFEYEVNSYETTASTRLKSQYREWASMMKKEGGMFLKNVKSKTNPAVKSAYKSVKDKSRRAYKDIRSKIQEMQRHSSQQDLMYKQAGTLPKSAPSSPTMTRPNTFDFGADRNHKLKNLDATNLAHSVTGIRHYKMLTVDETSLPSDESDTEGGPVTQPIDMDLMGVLQDLIFRKCSTSEDPDDSSSLSKQVQKTSAEVGFEDSFSDLNDVFFSTPIPPPRTRRKLTTSSKALSLDAVSFKAQNQVLKDEPLIKLDSFDDNLVFDPLLEKDCADDDEGLWLTAGRRISANQLNQNVQNVNINAQSSIGFSSASQQPTYSAVVKQPKSTSQFYCGPNPSTRVSKNTKEPQKTLVRDNKPPPLPPKKSSPVKRLSKQDQELLKDYGLGDSPLFKTSLSDSAYIFDLENPRIDSDCGIANSAVSTKSFDLLTNTTTTAMSAKTNGSTTMDRSSWQKFA